MKKKMNMRKTIQHPLRGSLIIIIIIIIITIKIIITSTAVRL